MNDAPILCTGAGGFIGRHLVRRLKRAGGEIWGLLGPADGPDAAADPGVHWVWGDVADRATLRGLERPFSRVYHLAGLNSSPDPASFYRVNYEGAVNVARAVCSGGRAPERFLLASSFGAMGPANDPGGLCEDTPCRPVSHYGRSKLMAELSLRSMAGALPLTIVRLPLVYGPGSRGGLYLYFKLINRGVCPCLPVGEATLGFVEDVVAGMVLAAETPGAEGAIFLLGEETARSIHEITSAIGAALDRRAVRIRVPRSLLLKCAAVSETVGKCWGGNAYRFRQAVEGFLQYPSWKGNITRAMIDLGFRARVPFEQGAKLTAEWYKARGLI